MAAPSQSFTVSELSGTTCIPVPRIKFYLREGLLPAGDLSAERRAFYGQQHAARLRLIHALREVAGLGIPAIRALCAQLDRPDGDAASTILHVLDALARAQSPRAAHPPRALGVAQRELRRFLRARGLTVRSHAPVLTELARALVAMREVLGEQISPEAFAPYMEAMLALAERDFAATRHLLQDRTSAGLAATYGTVLWEPVLILLRRIAVEHVARQRVGQASRRARPAGRR
jgi:DNA-binding transcriptional MerR regulator